jgi:hypothetical protein
MKLQTMREKIDPCEHCCPLETETDKFPFRAIPVSSERAVPLDTKRASSVYLSTLWVTSINILPNTILQFTEFHIPVKS